MRAPRVALLGQPFSKKNLYQDHFCDAKSMPLLVHNEKYFIFIMFRYHINSKSNESDMIFPKKRESDIHYLLSFSPVFLPISLDLGWGGEIGREVRLAVAASIGEVAGTIRRGGGR